MSYQWPVNVEALFEERLAQMINLGVPGDDVEAVRGRIKQMWPDEPGGWVYEWSQLAERYAKDRKPELAALAYGFAKFPTLADEAKRAAYRHQIDQYLLSADNDPVTFLRRSVLADHLGTRVPFPVHEFGAPDKSAGQSPVIIVSGGVDTWKEDLHSLWVALAVHTGMTVLAFDIPGTGESPVAMSHDGGPEIVSSLVQEARQIGNGRVAHLGVSMGGHFSARTGLSGEVDAAVVLGGPVKAAFEDAPFSDSGMHGIIGNALGFDHEPASEELAACWTSLSLAGLLAGKQQSAPMLIVNGADDPLVPQEDTLLFEARPGAEVRLIPDAGHCATSKLSSDVVPLIIDWLNRTMSPKDPA
ncbi:alpha/beta fold hydrolase [Streptomyces sp. NPDC007164]|uniref:alpha/beta hydrolase family protein n=2 Tax=unclassified Streptomyces TaxID=2593676 RepID=UPI0033C73B7D